MRRAFFGSGLAALLGLLALLMMPTVAAAQTTVSGTESDVVNVSAGNQTDPHVSGNLVAYTNAASFVESEIRYHDIASGSDAAIPNGGAFDFLSDISGSRIVFTRFNATASSIFVFDVTTGITTEVNPGGPGTNRVGAAIGGNIVAYVDQGLNADTAQTEIVVVDLTTGLATRLTTDALADSAPAVSPDGSVVVWTRCNLDGTGCDVVQAVGAGGAWTTTTLTGVGGEEGMADSNETIVVYDSLRSGAADRDVFYQPVGGGAEVRLALAGTQRNPAIAGGLIAFESDNGTSFDIFVYDTRTGTLHPITNSADDETLSDIFVGADGIVRVVYTAFNGVDFDVHAVTFGLPSTLPPADPLADLIAQLQSAPVGPGNSYLAKLQAVADSIGRGDTQAACNQLGAFENEVRAQAGKKLTQEEADALLAATAAIRTQAGCA